MSVVYPLFVFEKDDRSMRVVERPDRILYHLEAIDIENDEFLFWDSTGNAVAVNVAKGKVVDVSSSPPGLSLHDVLVSYAESLNLPAALVYGAPTEAWERIEKELQNRPKRKGLFSRLFSR